MALIELQLTAKDVACPVVNRLFYDTETGGISTMPVMAERGQDKDSELAKHIAWAIKRQNINREQSKGTRKCKQLNTTCGAT